MFCVLFLIFFFVFFKAEDGIRDLVRSRGLGDVYKRQVATLNEVKPGDLFMFYCTTGCNTSEGPALGHITIVDEVPKQKEPSAPLIDNTLQWVVTIIDSADGPHGKNDTRWRPQGEPKVNGVGRGSYRVYTDLQGVPVGYTNGINAPKFLNVTERPIGVGRPVTN